MQGDWGGGGGAPECSARTSIFFPRFPVGGDFGMTGLKNRGNSNTSGVAMCENKAKSLP